MPLCAAISAGGGAAVTEVEVVCSDAVEVVGSDGVERLRQLETEAKKTERRTSDMRRRSRAATSAELLSRQQTEAGVAAQLAFAARVLQQQLDAVNNALTVLEQRDAARAEDELLKLRAVLEGLRGELIIHFKKQTQLMDRVAIPDLST